jgi:AcrR family transcriptional regulator
MPKKKNPDTILPVPLSRERVLLAALRLADAEGLEALSMRNLAQELGVKAMSLYNHVKNKDDLIDGIVDIVGQRCRLCHGSMSVQRCCGM